MTRRFSVMIIVAVAAGVVLGSAQVLDTIRLVARPRFARSCYRAACMPAGGRAPLDPQLFQQAGHAP
jgi:hypothetical protein